LFTIGLLYRLNYRLIVVVGAVSFGEIVVVDGLIVVVVGEIVVVLGEIVVVGDVSVGDVNVGDIVRIDGSVRVGEIVVVVLDVAFSVVVVVVVGEISGEISVGDIVVDSVRDGAMVVAVDSSGVSSGALRRVVAGAAVSVLVEDSVVAAFVFRSRAPGRPRTPDLPTSVSPSASAPSSGLIGSGVGLPNMAAGGLTSTGGRLPRMGTNAVCSRLTSSSTPARLRNAVTPS
jgi:hypothetical protein